ncbi:MAG: isoprenylcysteine carboxylmethyltransferase family protein [Acidobacteriaceae bacterium]|nr:isoprenylcysteine carboxylmethyltransferase family protein [Acidobacteriaceae bacterium]
MHILRSIGWLISLVPSTIPCYWLLVHPRAEYWRSKPGARFRVLGPLWVAMWIAAGLVTRPWRHVLLYDAAWTWIPAASFVVIGFFLYSRAHLSFDQLIGRPEVQGEGHAQRLVTTGVHSRVRHPVYLGHLCELIGWSIATGLVVIYALTAFAALTGAVMIRAEESELERRFGEAYCKYKRRVPAVIPRFAASAPDLQSDAHG